jgi:lipoate-protein ligase A
MNRESFILKGASPLEHLAMESTLIDTWDQDSLLFLFYTNQPCLVIGRNQNPWKEANPYSSFPIYRRDSGGGTVYHDMGNLNWALIVPREIHDKEAELAMIAGALCDIGYPVKPGERGGLYCGTSSAHSGNKVSGTARRFGKHRVLHHGTLLVSSDLKALEHSLGGISTEDDRSLPSVPATAANILSIGAAAEVKEIARSLSVALCGKPCAQFSPKKATLDRIGQEEARLRSMDWIYGATPGFSFRLPHKGGPFLFSVKKGILGFQEGVQDAYFARFRARAFSFSTYFQMKETAEQALGSQPEASHRDRLSKPTSRSHVSKEA